LSWGRQMDKENGRTMVSDMGRAGEMVQTSLKKRMLLLILAMSMFGFGDTVLERKVLSDSASVNCSHITWIKMFLTQRSNTPFVLTKQEFPMDTTLPTPYRLYIPNNVVEVIKNEFGSYLGGFVNNDDLILVFVRENLSFYDVQKGFKCINSIDVSAHGGYPGQIIMVPEASGRYYLLSSCDMAANMFIAMISGGHGDFYEKPYLSEIKGAEVSPEWKIDYGGKRKESYLIQEVMGGKKIIHFLGLRGRIAIGSGVRRGPGILYYAGYDPEKKKTVQNYNLFEIKDYRRGSGEDFGQLSMSSKENNVFVVFTQEICPPGKTNFLDGIISNIYYFQYCNKTAGKTVQIAKGFTPLVKLDSTSKVYIFYVDYAGNLICKTKQGDTWGNDKTILVGVDIFPVKVYIAAEFDSEDNLHLVYPSKGSLIYEKRKLSEN